MSCNATIAPTGVVFQGDAYLPPSREHFRTNKDYHYAIIMQPSPFAPICIYLILTRREQSLIFQCDLCRSEKPSRFCTVV